MEKTRQSKIERLIQKELSNIFLAKELMQEKVLVKNLNNNLKSIRFALGQRLRYQLRIIPELRIFKDDTLDYMEHIDELLKK